MSLKNHRIKHGVSPENDRNRRLTCGFSWWKQRSVAGTGDHGSKGLFPRGIKATARVPSPGVRPTTH